MAIIKSSGVSTGLDSVLSGLSATNKTISAILPKPIEHDWYKKITRQANIATNISRQFSSFNRINELPFMSKNLTNHLNVIKSINSLSPSVQKMLNGMNTATSITRAFKIDREAMGTIDILRKHQGLFEKQFSLAKQLASQYDYFKNFPTTTIAHRMNNPVGNLGGVTNFDVFSGRTLQNIIEVNVDESTASKNLDVLSEIIESQAELKAGVQEVLQKVSGLSKKKAKKIKENELKSILEQLTHFFHRYVLRENYLTVQQTFTLMEILSFIVMGLIFNSAMEYKGGEAFESVFVSKKEIPAKVDTIQTEKNRDTVFVLQDFVIRDAGMYLRKSLKSKRIGIVQANTKVLVMAQKARWCLVEAWTVTISKKEGKVEKVRRGWVRKVDLDYFQ